MSFVLPPPIHYHTTVIDGVAVFHREAGPVDAPTIVLLHGFPSSSHMFRDLIPVLAQRYRVIAPDYPGFGHSEAPLPERFSYTFDRLADIIEGLLLTLKIDRFTLYLQDYGAPVGFRLATRRPEWVRALIVQNGNAYEDGLGPEFERMKPFWERRSAETDGLARALLTREATIFQYTHGTRDRSRLNPDAWTFDQAQLDRPGNDAIQLALLHDYRTNPPLYPHWQAFLRERRPPTLLVWGRHDPIFIEAGARAYQRDVPEAEIHLLETGHFALEDALPIIAPLIGRFLNTLYSTK